MTSLSRRFFVGAALASLIVPSVAKSAYLPFTKPLWNVLDYGVTGNGSTNDAAAINTVLTNATNAGAGVWFPGGKTYDLSSSSLTVPNNATVLCSRNAKIRRSADLPGPTPYNAYTEAMISIGDHVSWSGGELNNTAILTTSSTSNTIGTGSKSFTIATGLTLSTSTFLRIYSRANGANKFEGLVTSYNPGTGALVFNAQFSAGSGTFTDWDMVYGAVWQSPMVLHGSTRSEISGVRVTGTWFVGMLMEGWNPPAGGSLVVTDCTFTACFADRVLNRGFYMYGTTFGCTIKDCYVNGGSGITDYGFNNNPANASGSANTQQGTKILGCTSVSTGAQGITFGDAVLYSLISNCSVIGVVGVSGVGILIQKNVVGLPQFNMVDNCTVSSAVAQGIALLGTNGTSISACSVITCATGILFDASGGSNTTECAAFNVLVTGCTTGITVGAGAVNTIVSGRSYSNTTNLSNSGSGTVSTNLVTV